MDYDAVKSRLYPFQSGFTLIEVIVGMVVLSISMVIILSLIIPTEQQSVDQIHQIKASELGQSMLDEILGRAFDNNSDMVGSIWRCNETVPITQAFCTAENLFGPEDGNNGRVNDGEDNRNLFDDVDDYHEYSELTNSTNDELDGGYDSFQVSVFVEYDGDALNLANNTLAKRIEVTITTPLGTAIEFSGYKSNF